MVASDAGKRILPAKPSPPSSFFRDLMQGPVAFLAAILVTLMLLQCGHSTDSSHGDPVASHEEDEEDGAVWIKELTPADTILLTDLTDSSLGEADGLGVRKTEVSLYPYGFARHDNSAETNVFAGSPRDRSVGLDHMGARFYSPQLGIWTSADPAILTSPEQYVTPEFAAANPYAYANLRPVVAADRDGQFWHIAAGAAAGGLIGGGIEAARQYLQHGKIESWGRVGAATAGGMAAGTLAAVNPAAGLASVMGMGATSNVVGGITTRLVASGGKSAGTLTDVATDAAMGAGTAGIVKGGSSVLRKVLPKKPIAPPVSTAPVAKVGTSSASSSLPTVSGSEGAYGRNFYQWAGGGSAEFRREGSEIVLDGLKRGSAPSGSAGTLLGESIKASGAGRPGTIRVPNILQKYPNSNEVMENALSKTAESLGGRVSNVSIGVDTGKVWMQVSIAY